MSDNTFQKVGYSDARMFGPSKILVCGFPATSHEPLVGMLTKAGVGNLPIVFVTPDLSEKRLGELVELPGDSGFQIDSDLEPAVILSGLTENELQAILQNYRQSFQALELPKPLWATVTETSVNWSLKDLLNELVAEREAFLRRQRRKV